MIITESDLFIQAYCKPEGPFQDAQKPDHGRPGDWSHGRDDHDWYGHTTRARTKSIAETVNDQKLADSSSPSPTLLQSTTSGIALTLEDLDSTDDISTPTFKPLVKAEISSTKDDVKHIFQTVFHATGPIDDKTDKFENSDPTGEDKIGNFNSNFKGDQKNDKLGNLDTITAVNNETTVIKITHVSDAYNTLSLEYSNVKEVDKWHADNVQGKNASDNQNDVDVQAIGSIPVSSLNNTGAPAFQWHVGVYDKNWSPYMQICGGSLVKMDVVVSAAHCFWAGDSVQPASQFAVAGGKLYRPWNDQHDVYAQHSDVLELILPVRFCGSATSFQDDIAILRLSSPFTYAMGVQAVCLDFSEAFDREQLQPGNLGTVVGWGLTEENGVPSQRLNYLKLPYVDIQNCFAAFDPSFYKYITSDKICAGTQTGKALCRGDSGGGLIFFSNTELPYLRGIASTGERNENLCNAFTLATFTHIFAQRSFLKDNIPDIGKECAPQWVVSINPAGQGCMRFCRFIRSRRCRKCCRRTNECCKTKERYHWCKN